MTESSVHLQDAPAAASPRAAPSARDDNAKRRQILDGARVVFMAQGFDGASMNDVARAAGVSKGTLYVYFDSKEVLFEALIRDAKRRQAEQLCQFDAHDHDVRSALNGFGLRLLRLMLEPDSIAHLRTVMAVAGKFPAIGRAFYESGPGYSCKTLGAYFDAQVAAGVLAPCDTETAAAHFLDLCKSRHVMKIFLGVSLRPSDDILAQHVAEATDVFLRAYELPRGGLPQGMPSQG